MAVSTHACNCVHCRVAGSGLPAGPYTPDQYAMIAPPTVYPTTERRVSDDTQVQAAYTERDEARAVFDAADALWVAAVAEHQTAALLGNDPYIRDSGGNIVGHRKDSERVGRQRVRELDDAVKLAEKRRNLAWDVVVTANENIRKAQLRAQVKLVKAR